MKIFRPKLKNRMDGVFYWISPGQIWVTDCLGLRAEADGILSRFIPWSGFEDPHEDFLFNEVLDDTFNYIDAIRCEICNFVQRRVSEVRFSLRNDTAQPWVHGVGTAYINVNAKQLLDSTAFSGFLFIPNSSPKVNINNDSMALDYFFLSTNGFLAPVPGIIKEDARFCPNCAEIIQVCPECGNVDSRCRKCKKLLQVDEENFVDCDGIALNGSSWPAKLSTWNLHDVVTGVSWYAVTGELLEFLIENDITPFAFGPIDVECEGATVDQIERALKVRRIIPVEAS